jgi:hypothetical protein
MPQAIQAPPCIERDSCVGMTGTAFAVSMFATRPDHLVCVATELRLEEIRIMKKLLKMSVFTLTVLGLPLSAQTAKAEEVVVQRPEDTKDQTSTIEPSRTLLRSGIWVLGLSYVPAIVVATESSRTEDKKLYVPVAGPWIDLANRGACPANAHCNETSNRVLIVIDGIFQGFGALNIIGAFVFPETRTVSVSSSTPSDTHATSISLRVLPTRINAHTYGVAATGTF